jgi:putative RecB family exonuclease
MIAPALPLATIPPPKVRDYVSWSAINTYLQCPLRYKFRYVDQLPEEFLNGTLVFGQAIHAALEAYFRFHLTTGHQLGLDPLLAAYHEHWGSVDPALVRYGASDSLASFGQLAERMLSVFLTHDLSRPAGAIVSIEDEWRAPLIDGVPDVLAKLDLVIDAGDAVVVSDFKTSRSRWSAADAETAAGQLLLYGELVRREVARPVRLQFAVLTKTKQPELQIHAVASDAARVDRQQAMVRRVWRSIQGGHFYPHPSAMNCPTCPFQAACAEWTG